MASADNKRVAKNAIALTLRMVLVTIVGLFTSRIVLQALGVDDYGIYGVIGGVVGMASFLNTAMSAATSRFITFELGRGDHDRLQAVFSSALIIHICIALMVFILAETIGLWFVNAKMNFPSDRMTSVNILYQFTIISMMVGFTQVPYGSALLAHERMGIFAKIEVVNVFLKLLIVLSLLILPGNRLIYYAGMLLIVSVSISLFYRWYCVKNFPETHFKLKLDRQLTHEMLKYSGCDLYGHMCVVTKQQGNSLLLNMFFGVVANAGASIATTVTGAIMGLTYTVANAFGPQIIKRYAAGHIGDMADMMRRSLQFTMLAYTSLAIPFVLLTPQILYLWLGQVPEYSVEILRLIVLGAIIDIFVMTNNTAIHATGNIKTISFVSGTFYLLCPVISYILLRFMHTSVTTTYTISIVVLVVVTAIGYRVLFNLISTFPLRPYITNSFKSLISAALCFIALYYLKLTVPAFNPAPVSDEFWPIIGACAAITSGTLVLNVGLAFIIALNKSERQFLIEKFSTFFHKRITCDPKYQ